MALATQEALIDKMVSNIQEVKARGASVLALARKAWRKWRRWPIASFTSPGPPLLSPVLSVIPAAAAGLITAVARGCDVDKPRNLAKSVTVE